MPLNLEDKATVVLTVTLEGDISIGAHSVVHPHAVIKAGEGQIIIGKNNIVEEGKVLLKAQHLYIFNLFRCHY